MRHVHTALNRVFSKHRLQRQTVNVMQLVDHHTPKSRTELVQLLQSHSKAPKCRTCHQIVRNGGLRGWSLALHQAVQEEIDKGSAEACLHRVTIQDCVQFVTKLYITDPLNGYRRELQAMHDTNAFIAAEFPNLTSLRGRHATSEEDTRFKVDVVYDNTFGIQVKPETYLP